MSSVHALDAAWLARPPYKPHHLERLEEILRSLDPAGLEACLPTLDLQVLFRKAPQPYAQQLLDLLARWRAADLSLKSRALVIRALQEGPTPRRFEEAIRDLFLVTRGAELSALKRLVDASSSYHDLLQLLYHDIDVRSIRQTILAHFRQEAARVEHRELKVLSDVDDTLYCNWADKRYPPKTVYPGVRQLYLELDQGTEAYPSPLGDVTFLTGRPGNRGGQLEDRYHRNFAEKGLTNTVILTGTLLHQFAHPLIFERKWANFELYRQVYEDFDFVLFGDSGQADPAFLASAVRAWPEQVRAAMIHDVRGAIAEERAAWREQGVFFFDTYVGAAAELFSRGLLDRSALLRVVGAAREELAAVPFATDEQRRAREAELARDLERVERELAREGAG